MPSKAALPNNKQVLLGGYMTCSMKEPWWSRTGIEPTDLLIESGALPLSYGPVSKDGMTMPESGLV